MNPIFVRIYGNGIVLVNDLPESLYAKGPQLQAWVDQQYSTFLLGETYCLRIDRIGSEYVMHLMRSVDSKVLK